jgi:predicted DNA-binding protein (MmcQ/YjbR family)
MDIQQYFEYCLAKKGVTEHFPFDEDTLVFKVGGKMFALTSLSGWESGQPSVNLKCNPERGELLRTDYNDILPGYHMSKVHWNTVRLHGDVSDKLLKELIQHSYDLVLGGLPKKVQAAITESGQ